MDGEIPTYVTRLTPAGRGAIATIAVTGPHAFECVHRFFQPATSRAWHTGNFGEVRFGRWRRSDKSAAQGREQVIVAQLDPHRVEIHCHGGPAVIDLLLTDLILAGAKQQSWQQYVRGSQSDGPRADAMIALTEALTERTAMYLLAQSQGAFSRAIEALISQLSQGICAEVAAQIDAQLLTLLSRSEFGTHLIKPWRVVLAGPPNVGKSSLLNALLGYERAIVFDQPGTTRDVVTTITALEGWPVQFSDTAGVRSSMDPLEGQGIELTRSELASADLAILVFDGSQPWSPEATALARAWPAALCALNKSDLTQRAEPPRAVDAIISAKTGSGLPELTRQIADRLVPTAPPFDSPLPITTEQVESLRSAGKSLRAGDTAAATRILSQLLGRPIS
jgi:tRNA modification GTPase